jgi:glycosyltransferase involved in cell wall biosynthesis
MTEEKIAASQEQDKPLVTFALFAYNQEKYIREAIEGAFAQTYEPLEIILSDDCSTDRTFEIMQEMVSSYRGASKITARQTKKNLGTLLHVAEVAKLAKGKLLVLAAGDDISLAERTETIVNAWQSTGAWGFCSRFNRIDETGQLTAHDQISSTISSSRYPLRRYFQKSKNPVEIIHGATSAYDRRLFDFLDTQSKDYILSEDGALTVLLNLLNKEIKTLDSSLVCYRENEQSLTNSGMSKEISLSKIQNDEVAITRLAHSQANRCDFFLRLYKKYGANSKIKLDTERIQLEMKKHQRTANWWNLRFVDKLRHLIKVDSFTEFKWLLPRVLPKSVFIRFKTISKGLIRLVRI